MTISEQIREAALYADEPWLAIESNDFQSLRMYGFQAVFWCGPLDSTEGRTWLLLVAEALE